MSAKTIADFEAYVVQERIKGNHVSLYTIISEYMIRMQRTTLSMIRDYVYKQIGNDYRCSEFDAKIENLVNQCALQNKMTVQGEMYIINIK